jgi:hypothetical protein
MCGSFVVGFQLSRDLVLVFLLILFVALDS